MSYEVERWSPVLEHANALFEELVSRLKEMQKQAADYSLGRRASPPENRWLLKLGEDSLRSACLGAAIAYDINEAGK